MADNLMNGLVMDLDLNQEPMESSSGTALGLGSLLNDLKTAHRSRIEQRIRQLEAVAARTWQRHTRRSQARNSSSDDIGNNNLDNEKHEKGCKRDRSHLVAKALEMDLVVKKVGKDGGSGSFFDCNICLDMAQEPILTCCGHLYCWSCFYQLPYVDSGTKECPVCKGEVIDENVTPIYGNGRSYCSKELVECGLKIPPRPKAHRVESVRQQHVNRGLSHIPVAEALRRIRTSIGLGDHPSQQLATGDTSSSSLSSSHELQNADPIASRGLRSRVFPRVLSEGAASLSSELENAQQMFEGLAASLTDRIRERNNSQVLPISHVAADEDSSLRRDAAIIRSERQTLDSIVETSSATSSVPTSQSNEVSYAALQLENLTTDAGNLPVSLASLSSRRRSGFSRLSDLDSGLLRETRRRRLN